MAKKLVYFGLVGALSMSAYLTPYVGAQAAPLDLKYFKEAETIQLFPDTLLIAGIDHMDVDPTGRVLVVDQKGRQAFLFDSTGILQTSLDPTVCHPGFFFYPMTARFAGDAFIFVQNSGGGGWGFRFTAEGDCLGRADLDYRGNREFAVDPSGILYDVTRHPWDLTQRVLRHMDPTGKELEVFPMPSSKVPNAVWRLRGGGLIADGEHIFYASSVEAQVLKFALDGTLDDQLVLDNSWFQFPRRDLSPDAAAFLRELRKWGPDITTIERFFELTDQTLFVQYGGKKGEGGYQVISKEGVLIAEEMGIPLMPKFLHGEYGLLYRVIQPSRDSEGEYPNLYIQTYRFVMP